jgi:hypothetical protein
VSALRSPCDALLDPIEKGEPLGRVSYVPYLGEQGQRLGFYTAKARGSRAGRVALRAAYWGAAAAHSPVGRWWARLGLTDTVEKVLKCLLAIFSKETKLSYAHQLIRHPGRCRSLL